MRRLLATIFLLNAGLLALACSDDGDNENADLNSCGDIEVEASAQCEVVAQGGCEAQCSPVSFTAACEGQCDASLEASCQADCTGVCEGECQADPGNYSCEGECQASCGAQCSASCEAQPDQASCEAGCQARCDSECNVSCEGTPPSASCEAKCEASCEGECTAEANIDCHIDCQAELEGGCEVECQSPEGALFCDGQYVDHGGNLEECIAALNAYLEVEVDSSGSAACGDGACSAEGEASISCAMAPPATGDESLWLLALAGFGLTAARRRRR